MFDVFYYEWLLYLAAKLYEQEVNGNNITFVHMCNDLLRVFQMKALDFLGKIRADYGSRLAVVSVVDLSYTTPSEFGDFL